MALARAIVFKPDILLMDEPLGALDKNLRQNLQIELKKLHRKIGATIIYVTHDQEEAMHMSDRVVVTNQGHIEQIGTAKELYSRPRNVFVAGFLGECNLIAGEVAGAENGSLSISLENGHQVRVRHGDTPPKAATAVKVGIRPEHLKVGQEAEKLPNRLDALVEEVIFSGSSYKIYVQVGAQVLISAMPNRKDFQTAHPGQKVALGFDPAEAFVLSV